jgi:tRNA(fMet)-specific endonuclease VapC
LSSIAVLEIVHGYRRVGREAKIASFESALRDCTILPFDEAAGRLAGRIYADLELRGRPIGMPDVMIASIALENRLVLCTGTPAISKRSGRLGIRSRSRTGGTAKRLGGRISA